MPTDLPRATQPVLGLPETKLFLFESELVRESSNQCAVLRLPLQSLTRARMTRVFSIYGVVFMATGLGTAAITYFVSSNSIASVVFYVLALLIFLIGVPALVETRIVLECGDESHSIEANDSPDVVEGFVLSLNTRLGQ